MRDADKPQCLYVVTYGLSSYYIISRRNVILTERSAWSLLKAINLNSQWQDRQTTSLNADVGFTTEIPRLSDYEEIENETNTMQCYVDGSKMNEQVGAGVQIVDNEKNTLITWSAPTYSFQSQSIMEGSAAEYKSSGNEGYMENDSQRVHNTYNSLLDTE